MLSRPPVRLGELRKDVEDAALGMRQMWDYVSFTPLLGDRAAGDEPLVCNADWSANWCAGYRKFGDRFSPSTYGRDLRVSPHNRMCCTPF